MKPTSYYLILFFVIFTACTKDSTRPEIAPTSGKVTVTSEVIGNQASGFSFELGEVITLPNSQDILPDLLVLVQQGSGGEILGVFFAATDLTPTFSLIGEKSTLDSSRAIFNGLNEIPDTTTFADLAHPVNANQVWAVKTRENKYAKILVLATSAFIDSANTAGPTPYGEVTFEWVYQPDGGRIF